VTGVTVCGAGTCVRGPGDDGSWFDVRRDLGRHGYKYLPPACQHLLVAARRALHGDQLADTAPDARGVVVGANHATSALLARMDRTVVTAGSAELSPLDVPFGTVNVLTSRLAIEHGCTGFALTTVSPVTAGLEALRAAERALRAGRAEVVLVGAMEAPPPGENGDENGDEGAAVLVVRRGTGGLSCSARTLLLPPRRWRESLDMIKIAVTALADRELPLHVALDGSALADEVAAVVRDVCGREPVSHTATRDGALTPFLRLAELASTGADALLLVAAGTGNVGLVRITQQAGQS
jgi:3-oxoacyl-[acyl-carrier-protein] synthase II